MSLTRLRTTNSHINYWKNRKIDWVKDYASTVDHPHRKLIIEELQKMKFGSIMEVGCASGPNLLLIKRVWPHMQVGGCDVSKDAITTAKQLIPDGIFDVQPADQLWFDDKSVDIGLSDACLIYSSKKKTLKALKEMKRVVRKKIILVEFHEPSFFKRLGIYLSSGYFAHDWPKLLEKAGFHNIEIKKIPKQFWPGMPWEFFGYIITASV